MRVYPIYAYSWLRSLNFTVQGALLPYIDRLATLEKREAPKDFKQHMIEALPKINALLLQDAENIAAGYYPADVLRPENLWSHAKRWPLIIEEAFASAKRRKNNINKNFDLDTENIVIETPEYYARNFHFQNSGYLSSESARLYEHQVEMLFSGAANAMRRLILVDLKKRLGSSDGEGLNFLELGGGTGALTQFIALAFPKANVTCVDLSPYYLQEAKRKLHRFKRINFMKANAEDLPFKDGTFDVVYSCYMFHEIPPAVRRKIMTESVRVAKSNALIGVVDSLQHDDDADFEWALKQFPIDFHEPFYKSYIENSLQDLFVQTGLLEVEKKIGFLTKSVLGRVGPK
ncbi:MAG: class I SAM-dependent methyltransferase [Bdellovibrionaceae bacterium]|nr:class I SAM-dependent methyltransferase [Pseudobdellovibrionaceae bacterium]